MRTEQNLFRLGRALRARRNLSLVAFTLCMAALGAWSELKAAGARKRIVSRSLEIKMEGANSGAEVTIMTMPAGGAWLNGNAWGQDNVVTLNDWQVTAADIKVG